MQTGTGHLLISSLSNANAKKALGPKSSLPGSMANVAVQAILRHRSVCARGWKRRVWWGRFLGALYDWRGPSVTQQFSPGPIWVGLGALPLSGLCDHSCFLLLIPMSFWRTAKSSHAKWQFIHRMRMAHLWLNLVPIGRIKNIKHLTIKYEAKRAYQLKWTAKDHHHKSSLAFAFYCAILDFVTLFSRTN